MSDLTLRLPGHDLAAQMTPDPPVLDWHIGSYILDWPTGDEWPPSLYAYGTIVLLQAAPHPEGKPWFAECYLPNGSDLDEPWFDTPEAAKAAVEEHIAKLVEQYLGGKS